MHSCKLKKKMSLPVLQLASFSSPPPHFCSLVCIHWMQTETQTEEQKRGVARNEAMLQLQIVFSRMWVENFLAKRASTLMKSMNVTMQPSSLGWDLGAAMHAQDSLRKKKGMANNTLSLYCEQQGVAHLRLWKSWVLSLDSSSYTATILATVD